MSDPRPRRRRRRIFTDGEWNGIIDAVCHPLAKEDEAMLIFDSLLHILVEGDDPTVAITKFAKFNLPKFVRLIFEASVKGDAIPPSRTLAERSVAKRKKKETSQ